MVKIIKKIIKLFFKKLGYEIRWQYPELVQMSFNEIYQKFFHKTKVIIFDVGANKGDYAVLAREISSKAKIYAFEPSKDVYKILEQKYITSKNITLKNDIEVDILDPLK